MLVTSPPTTLGDIEACDQQLLQHFSAKMIVQPALTRSLVSFQANKDRAVYRWYKYKEAFSASLVEYILRKYEISNGLLLDPFAGSGTTLFAASALGVDADGIELLSIGQQIINTKRLVEKELTGEDISRLQAWLQVSHEQPSTVSEPLPELRITKGAYSAQTKNAIEHYLGAAQQENPRIQSVLMFALLCVLETVSYTRKDGQYLRWDYRSSRKQRSKPFDKGPIPSFDQAITAKLAEILDDISPSTSQLGLFSADDISAGVIRLHVGSSLDLMPELPDQAYDVIITSPPYCNRYDYTRTYALELALLGIGEQQLIQLRQDMLSCTVENRAKDLTNINPTWASVINMVDEQTLLQTILKYLESQKQLGLLNNSGIPRMVRGYFYEMACIIAESARVLKSGAPLFMINDNVRYAGASISVDLILSDFAEKLGFHVESIFVLPNGKGNSSQQMGEHGRQTLRKCMYIWRKV